jgi:predicted ABC-type ATPase
MNHPKRLRIFAGPNGSGKSSLVSVISDKKVDLGVYVNADSIKKMFEETGSLDFKYFGLTLDLNHLIKEFGTSTLYYKSNVADLHTLIQNTDNHLTIVANIPINDYFTSFLAEYIRNLLLDTCNKFTIETVMSHTSKIEFIKTAKEKGFKIYLYFISLENPKLCIHRVKARVEQGGHDVPEQKITERYARTMNYLLDAIRLADRAFLFDNSYSTPKLFAIVENEEIKLENTSFAPLWFQKYVLDKLH